MSILNVISGTKYSRHSLIRLSKDQFSAEFVEKIVKLDCNDSWVSKTISEAKYLMDQDSLCKSQPLYLYMSQGS